MISGYEDKTEFVECKFQVFISPEQRKVPVTSDMETIVETRPAIGYHITHITCRRTGGKETKAYPTIRIPINIANWRYPKQECQKAIAFALENPAWVRSFHSSPRWLMTITWRREAVIVY